MGEFLNEKQLQNSPKHIYDKFLSKVVGSPPSLALSSISIPRQQVFVFVIVCVCFLRFSTMKMIHISKQQYKYHSVHSKWPQKDLDEEQKPFHGSSWICFGFKTNQELLQKGFPLDRISKLSKRTYFVLKDMFEYRFIRLTGDLFCVRFSTG